MVLRSAWEGVRSIFEKIGLNGTRGDFDKNRVNIFNGACYCKLMNFILSAYFV